jgi:N-acetylglucosaminyldiphosphoundecaprenol N-acetyl-beta-D-mannosaminyltransferase
MTSDARVAVVLGAPVDDVTVGEAVDRIAAMVADGRATGRVHQVVTVNVDFVVNAQDDEELLAILQRSDLAIPDGMPLVWGSRLLGTPIRERATGVELLPALVERATRDGYRICLFGAAPGVAARAAELLTTRYPGADVVGLEAPVVGRDGSMDPAGLEPVRAADPDIVGVALGNPKQEHWIARHGSTLGCPVFIGIGGTLDFLTGETTRAPGWMQRAGFEWLHRALSEPRRLAMRYARDIVVYLPGLARQAWRGRHGHNATVAAAATSVRNARHRGQPPPAVDPIVLDVARGLGAGGIFTA